MIEYRESSFIIALFSYATILVETRHAEWQKALGYDLNAACGSFGTAKLMGGEPARFLVNQWQ
jgi:hypothetical protein